MGAAKGELCSLNELDHKNTRVPLFHVNQYGASRLSSPHRAMLLHASGPLCGVHGAMQRWVMVNWMDIREYVAFDALVRA